MRSLLTLLCLMLGATTAGACGNPLLWAMLFKKVPEAKVVFEAELVAREEGLITARVYDAKPGQPYHLWSTAWILDLAGEMQPVVKAMLAPGDDVTILLADEVAVLRFSSKAGAELLPLANLNEAEGYDVITSINALKSLWRDGLTYQEASAQNLMLAQDKNVHRQWAEAF